MTSEKNVLNMLLIQKSHKYGITKEVFLLLNFNFKTFLQSQSLFAAKLYPLQSGKRYG